MRGAQASGVLGPVLREVEPAIDKRLALARYIGGKHADLTVRDLAGRARVLAANPAGGFALLEKARLVQNQHRIRLAQGLDRIAAHHIAECISVPLRSTQ